jgi:predicted glycosyltransferase
MPNGLGSFGSLAARLNFKYHKNYLKVIIPDLPDSNQGLLSGSLSRLPRISVEYTFGGILSSITRQEAKETIDLLVSISGPEPQRTVFEQQILQQIGAVPGRKVVVLGKSESVKMLKNNAGLKVYSHLPRREMNSLFNQAKLIISRPGYSTLMELVELGKQALLVPTPGQTEQAALAKHTMKKNWFYSVDQNKLDLGRDVENAKNYAGLFKPNVTAWSIGNIFDNVLKLL